MGAEDWHTWVWATNLWMNATETWWFLERTSPPPSESFPRHWPGTLQTSFSWEAKPYFPTDSDAAFELPARNGRDSLFIPVSLLLLHPSLPPSLVSVRLGALFLATSIPFPASC